MKSFLFALIVVGLGSLRVDGQAPADFTGIWKMDMSRSESSAQEVPIGPVTVAIRQTPGEVRIETTANGSAQTVTYLPIGSLSPVAASEDPPATFRWDGSKLMTVLKTDVNNRAVMITEVRHLDPLKAEMTVETTLAIQHGYTGPSGGVLKSQNTPHASTVKNVFLKAH